MTVCFTCTNLQRHDRIGWRCYDDPTYIEVVLNFNEKAIETEANTGQQRWVVWKQCRGKSPATPELPRLWGFLCTLLHSAFFLFLTLPPSTCCWKSPPRHDGPTAMFHWYWAGNELCLVSSCTEERLLSSRSAIEPRSMEGCSAGCPTDLCLATVLFLSSAASSFGVMAWLLLWCALSPVRPLCREACAFPSCPINLI